ncbi:hypothetical protein EBU94_00485 [bacterium]|nr:hypothetical protein [bacterium]
MPLVKEVLKSGIETKLKTVFTSEETKADLRKKLDGGLLSGVNTGTENLYDAFEAIKDRTEQILEFEYDPTGLVAANSEELIRKVSSNEQANAIAESICEWMADEIAPAIAEAVADNVDTFIKSATIITPAGQAITGANAGGPVTGSTISPSSPAIIS